MDEDHRKYVDEVVAKSLDLLEANPELKDIPADKIAKIFQAGVMAGYEAATSIMNS